MSNLENFIPILPLRDIVVFPHMIVPLFVGRDKSIKALEAVMSEDKKVFLIAQKDGSVEDPSEKDLYRIGTLGNILQLLKLPDGTVKVLVEGISRARIKTFKLSKETPTAQTPVAITPKRSLFSKSLRVCSRCTAVITTSPSSNKPASTYDACILSLEFTSAFSLQQIAKSGKNFLRFNMCSTVSTKIKTC